MIERHCDEPSTLMSTELPQYESAAISDLQHRNHPIPHRGQAKPLRPVDSVMYQRLAIQRTDMDIIAHLY